MAFAAATTSLCVLAPAKLNLHLELLRRRPDGYHDLETVMLAIDLCDDVQVRAVEGQATSFRCHWAPHTRGWCRKLGHNPQMEAFHLPPSENNLAWKAVRRFREVVGYEDGLEICVGKRIPMGAGLGGASADAAGVLVALAALTGIDPLDAQIMMIAEGLGSDVPFLLAAAAGEMTACVARGRGEVLRPIEVRKDLHFVLLYTPHPLSTAAVYQRSKVPLKPIPADAVVARLCDWHGRGWGDVAHNRLQAPACELQPLVQRSLDALMQAGATDVAMTGSGAACFGICRSAEQARRVARYLANKEIGLAMAVRPLLSRQPTQELAA